MITLERPLCMVDLESTGTNVNTDRIVEISILKILPDGTKEIRTRKVNPGIPIPKGASDVHGITDELVANEAVFGKIAKALHAYIEGCDLGGFNSNRFDFPMLYNEFLRAGINWDYSSVNMIDVGNIYKINEPRTLSAAVKFYMDKDLDDAHSAEADINATWDVLLAQMGKYPDLPKSLSELAYYSNFDADILDLSGKFKRNEDGFIVYTFGKHVDQPVINHRDFFDWMCSKNFPPDTLAVGRKIFSGELK